MIKWDFEQVLIYYFYLKFIIPWFGNWFGKMLELMTRGYNE